MKNLILLFSITLLLFSGCKEIPPSDLHLGAGGMIDTSNTSGRQVRRVLVEEYTGVQCTNCPNGASVLNTLKNNLYGNRLILVGIHTGFLADSIPESTQNLNCGSLGINLNTLMGNVIAKPAAIIDRWIFDGETALYVLQTASWAGYIQSEASTPPDAKLLVSYTYDDTTRALQINVTGQYYEDINEPVNVSVMIAEDSIVNAQDMADLSTNLNYLHRHVLRSMATPFAGAPITGTTKKNDPINQSFNTTLKSGWVAKHCHIVAFLSYSSDHYIIQAAEAEIH